MRLLVLLASLLVVVGCDTISETSVQGMYAATVFVEVGPTDGSVDVLAGGGHLILNLWPDGRFETFAARPIGQDEMARDYVSGTYRLDGRRLVFAPDSATWALGWVNEAEVSDRGDRLETPDLPGFGAPFKIVLERRFLECATGLGKA